MRNAALVLGVIGGLMALAVGVVSYGYVAFIDWFGPVPDIAEQVAEPGLVRLLAVLSPLLAIAGAAMARARALPGGALMLLSAAGFYHGFGIGPFTIFPLSFIAVAGVIALAAGRPDEDRAHF